LEDDWLCSVSLPTLGFPLPHLKKTIAINTQLFGTRPWVWQPFDPYSTYCIFSALISTYRWPTIAIMSVLSPEIHAELNQLLQALQSPDNGVRSQAEEHLQNNWTNTRPEMLLMGLAEQIQGSQDVAVSLTTSSVQALR
jgi:hypothetical protein